MPLNTQARAYAEALFSENPESRLPTQPGGFTKGGPHIPQFESLPKIACARAEALSKAYEHDGQTLNETVVAEIMDDVARHVQTIAAARASSYSGELSRFHLITSQHDGSASAKAGEVRRKSQRAVADAITAARNFLTIRMHEGRDLNSLNKGQPSTTPATVTNIYNLHGLGSKVNINSNDSSVNVNTVTENEFFANLRNAINTGVAGSAQRDLMLAAVSEMQSAAGSHTFAEKYQRFIASAANHMTLLAPFMPVLMQMLLK